MCASDGSLWQQTQSNCEVRISDQKRIIWLKESLEYVYIPVYTTGITPTLLLLLAVKTYITKRKKQAYPRYQNTDISFQQDTVLLLYAKYQSAIILGRPSYFFPHFPELQQALLRYPTFWDWLESWKHRLGAGKKILTSLRAITGIFFQKTFLLAVSVFPQC